MAEKDSTSAALERSSPTQFRFHYYRPGVKWRVSPHTLTRSFEYVGTGPALASAGVIGIDMLPGAPGQDVEVTSGYFFGVSYIAQVRRDGTFSVTRDATEHEKWEKRERVNTSLEPTSSMVSRYGVKIGGASDIERWLIGVFRRLPENGKSAVVSVMNDLDRNRRKRERAASVAGS